MHGCDTKKKGPTAVMPEALAKEVAMEAEMLVDGLNGQPGTGWSNHGRWKFHPLVYRDPLRTSLGSRILLVDWFGKFLHIHCSLPRVFWDIQCVDVIRRSLILLGDIRTFAMKGRVRV